MFKISFIGCGWLGTRTAHYLNHKGHEVTGSATRIKKANSLALQNINSTVIKITDDIASSTYNTDFFRSDILIISLKPNRQNDDKGYFKKQINTIAQLAEQNHVKKIIFWSSTSVYGDNKTIVDESSALNPTRPSGFSLIEAENILLSNTNFKTTVLRLGGLIGYERNPYETIKQNKKAGSLFVPVNLVHADDVIQITELALSSTENQVFNVVSDQHPLRIDYYAKAYTELGVLPEAFNQNAARNFKVVNNTKIKQELNYSFLLSNPNDIYHYQSPLNTQP